MSKNEKMVSVPRALAERISNICMFSMYKEDWRALSEILAKPAEQHQSEPVELPERKDPNASTGCYGLEEYGWNDCLDEIAKLGPLYTHADPGEVERLRAELAAQHKRLMAVGMVCDDTLDKYGKLKEQLTERDALLRDIDDFMDREDVSPGYDIELRMSKVFTSSTEPSTPECKCDMRTKLVGDGCATCNPERAADLMEPSAPVEIDERAEFAERCDGKEQEAFEAWAIGQKYDMACHPLHWLFLDAKTYAARQGWAAGLEYATGIARAALERKPSDPCREAIQKLRKTICLPESVEKMLDQALKVEPVYEIAGYEGTAGLYYSRLAAVANGEQMIEPVYRVKK